MNVATMPGPRGRPRETVSPEVSECRRMPLSRRPHATATTAWPPSWAMVTTCRARRHAGRIARGRAALAVADQVDFLRAGQGQGLGGVAFGQCRLELFLGLGRLGEVTEVAQGVLDALAEFGVRGEIRAGRVGVWVTRPDKAPNADGSPHEDKIAALLFRPAES